MSDEKLGLGEQALSKAAEVVIATQVEQAENLTVEVHAADGLQTLQGEVNAVHIEGTGVVIDKDVRVEQLAVHTDTVSVDLMKALFGQVQLDKPLDATASVVITEADLNRAANSALVSDQMQNLPLKVNDLTVQLSIDHVKFCLPDQTRIAMEAQVTVVYPQGNRRKIGFTSVFCIEPEQGINLERFQCNGSVDCHLPLDLAGPLLAYVSSFLSSRRLTYQGMVIYVKHIEPRVGSLALQTEVRVETL